VAAVPKQDLVQVVALLVAVEDRLDARVELGGPVRDWVGGGADAVENWSCSAISRSSLERKYR
jgi:hypothetical protein